MLVTNLYLIVCTDKTKAPKVVGKNQKKKTKGFYILKLWNKKSAKAVYEMHLIEYIDTGESTAGAP